MSPTLILLAVLVGLLFSVWDDWVSVCIVFGLILALGIAVII